MLKSSFIFPIPQAKKEFQSLPKPPAPPGPPVPPPPEGFESPSDSESFIFNPSRFHIRFQSNEKHFKCEHETISIIFENDLHLDIENKYEGKITKNSENLIQIYNPDLEYLRAMEAELELIIDKYTFDKNATWAFSGDNGQYVNYDPKTNQIIENHYKKNFFEMSQPFYENYSKSVEVDINCVRYSIQFAKVGGVHRQQRKLDRNTIRAIKRKTYVEKEITNQERDFVWLWQHESGNFMEYENESTILIENCYIEFNLGQTDYAVRIPGKNGSGYFIDFTNMVQYNEKTNVQRKIMRKQIEL